MRVGTKTLDRERLNRALSLYAVGELATIAALAADLGISSSTAQRLFQIQHSLPSAPAPLLSECRTRAIANRSRGGVSRRLLSAEQVQEIRTAHESGAAIGLLARHYGLSRSLIRHLLAGRTYRETTTPRQDGNNE